MSAGVSRIDGDYALNLYITERLNEAVAAARWLESHEAVPLALISYKTAVKQAIGTLLAQEVMGAVADASGEDAQATRERGD